jgi:NAD(P)-dependent dehydrogenase (short-subunit alcohol dehydrogenase family)
MSWIEFIHTTGELSPSSCLSSRRLLKRRPASLRKDRMHAKHSNNDFVRFLRLSECAKLDSVNIWGEGNICMEFHAPSTVAIITGSAQGIGAAYAEGLAKAGCSVAMCDILDPGDVPTRLAANGARVLFEKVDITDASAVTRFVARVKAELGGLHVLINNAAMFGTLSRTPMEEISSSAWDKVMTVNVRGTFECIKAAVPVIRSQKYGKIINISSTTVAMGQPMLLHYVTSKGAIIAMTRSLARELGGDGITVNSISPGFTLSEAIQNNPRYTTEIKQSLSAVRAIKRDQIPADLVDTVVFLASKGSDFITGQNLIVDGGANMQ